MAKETVTYVTDDLDGSKDATEVAFSFGGVDYTIDLSKKNLSAFEKALKPYLDAATRVPASRRSAAKVSASGLRRDLAAIREWARANGIEVSDRGVFLQRLFLSTTRPAEFFRGAAFWADASALSLVAVLKSFAPRGKGRASARCGGFLGGTRGVGCVGFC